MSNAGQSPTVKRIRYTAQSTDPVNPLAGDLFVSDGTPRAIGPWVYFSGAWQQISTSGSLATVNDLTFVPQAATPGSPTTGMVFYSDGTSRAAGLWLYDGTGWIQLSGVKYVEFFLKDYVDVRVATTANIILVSQAENGDTIDGVVLATNDIILIKNQTTASENGVYVVQVSGTPLRHSSADTAAELNNYVAYVTAGTANANTSWFQNSTLTTLADPQSWATAPTAKSFTLPSYVSEVEVIGAGGGGGGGNGGGINNTTSTTGGGGGGAGAGPWAVRQKVTGGETISVLLGKGGLTQAVSIASTGADGLDGTSSTVAFAERTIIFSAGKGGHGAAGSAGGAVQNISTLGAAFPVAGGGAGGTNGAGNPGEADAYVSVTSLGGTGTLGVTGSGGGGGGSGMVKGSDGANAPAANASGTAATKASNGGGAGGGGGSGIKTNAALQRNGGRGGAGGAGYVRISW